MPIDPANTHLFGVDETWYFWSNSSFPTLLVTVCYRRSIATFNMTFGV